MTMASNSSLRKEIGREYEEFTLYEKEKIQTTDVQSTLTPLCPQSNQMLMNFLSWRLHQDHSM